VASGVGDSVAAFDRSTSTGRITQLAGTAGCYTNHERTLGRCASAVQLDGPEGIAVSPDGNSVYVGAFNSNAVAVFDRVSDTGTITQRSGANGCIVNVATTGCTTGNALGNANALAVSPYGGNVYVGSYAGNAIDVFARAQPRNGRVAARVPSRLTVASGTVVSVPVVCSGSRNRRCPGGLTLQASSQRLATASLSTIGRGSFNIPRGKSERVSVALSASARHYLNDNGSLPVVATLRVVQPSGRIEVFRERVVLMRERST
jgi:DNA-binding beta-propeller fold protein YncE